MDDLITVLAERGIEPIGAEGAPRSVHVERRVVMSTAPHGSRKEESDTQGEDEQRTDESAPVLSENANADPGVETTQGLDRNESVKEKAENEKEIQVGNRTLEQGRPVIATDSRGGQQVTPQRPYISLVRTRVGQLKLEEYVEYSGAPGKNPNSAYNSEIAEGLTRIIGVEGPVVAKRAYDIYLRTCGIRRLGRELQKKMNKALQYAIRQGLIVCEDELAKGGLVYSVIRLKGTPPVRLRKRGPRLFEEIPPSELNAVSTYLAEQEGCHVGTEEHMRMVLEWFDLKRLTAQTSGALKDIVNMQFPYVNDLLQEISTPRKEGAAIELIKT